MRIQNFPTFSARPQLREFKQQPPPEQEPPASSDQVDIARFHVDRGLGLLWGAALGGLVGAAGGSALAGALVGGLAGSLAGPMIGLADHLFERPNSPLQ